MNIKIAQIQDSDAIKDLYLSAFLGSENKSVAQLATKLLAENVVSFVAVENSEIIGNIIFSPVVIKDSQCRASILAPLAVSPLHQHQGIGSQLIRAGTRMLQTQHSDVVFVYGDPLYYGKFGFTAENNTFIPPYILTHPTAWQYKILNTKYICRTNKISSITCLPPLMQQHLW